MAESLTEGTLRSFAYEVGDFVEQDAEIASIETVCRAHISAQRKVDAPC